MILSASRRTDIPCHYSSWLMGRLRAGYALARNPMNHSQLSRINLGTDVVDAIVFWTKDPRAMLLHLPELDSLGYRYCFQFTITPYGADFEPGLRPKRDIISTFVELSGRIGRERMLWRYDPILFGGSIDAAWHVRRFERLCELLAPHARHVTVSFLDMYAKLRSPLLRAPLEEEIFSLSGAIGEIARAYNLNVYACCEGHDLSCFGILRGSCIDRGVLGEVCGYPLSIARDANQRKGCGCAASVDIGAYNTCPNGCVYCYANQSADSAARRFAQHDPRGELLTGSVAAGERISVRKLSSHRGGG